MASQIELGVVEAAFFVAMNRGYAADGSYGINPYGERVYEVCLEASAHKPPLTVLDRYFHNRDTRMSTGQTIILAREIPVWVMNYGGHYPKEAIPLLKQALMAAYERKEFTGGRGPAGYITSDCPGWYYGNCVDSTANTFAKFRCREHIEKDEAEIGWHECWGMALI